MRDLSASLAAGASFNTEVERWTAALDRRELSKADAAASPGSLSGFDRQEACALMAGASPIKKEPSGGDDAG